MLADMLGGLGRFPRDEFDVDDCTFAELVQTVDRWRLHLRLDPPSRERNGPGIEL